MDTQRTEDKRTGHEPRRGRTILVLGIGLVVGAALAAAAGWTFMPGMMLNVHQSRLGFDETVSAVQRAVAEQGWVLAGTRDMRKSLADQGHTLDRRVKIVELCHPGYARRVLTSDRELAALMPCSIAVYEGDDGKVYVSKMNTGLMGRMFGGTVAEVMGGPVADDERAILSGIVDAK